MTKQQLDDKVTFDGFSLGDLMNFGNYILQNKSRYKHRGTERLINEISNTDIENWKESLTKVECCGGSCEN